MPNKSSSGAFIDPAQDLTFSGAAIVVQEQVTALMQTSEVTGLQSQERSLPTAGDFAHAGLLPGSQNPDGLQAPESAEAATLSPVNEDGEAQQPAETGPAELCDTTISDIYCVYTIQEGDTLSSIADRFGLTSNENFVNWELLVHSNNSVVVDPDDVAPGLKLIIPGDNGTIHTVSPAQTLTDIAEIYGVSVEAIMAITQNGVSDPNAVGVGTELFIPNPERFAPIFIADVPVPPADDDPPAASSAPSDGSPERSAPPETASGPSSASGFMWPVTGRISSYFGPNHPLGIDIDLFHNPRAPIVASMGGVVTFAGGNPCCSYGYYVVVDHGNGFQTRYAHLSAIGVSVGEVVAQGQYIGTGGSTGYSTGDHLHFEVILNGSVVNPLNYLP